MSLDRTPQRFADRARALAMTVADGARDLVVGAGRATLELVVPPLCVACGRRIGEADALCGECWRSLRFIRPPLCDRLGIPMPFDPGGPIVSASALADPPLYDRARAVAVFGPVLRQMIHAFKYGDQHHARALFGRWLLLAGAPLLGDAQLIMPVPLHRWRLLTRRFNQSAILALELERLSGIPTEMTTLQRIKRTASQVQQTANQRRQNMAGAFVVPESRLSRIAGRNVLLIDDVITTGATVNACARALKAAGAARVDVLALALALDGPDADDLDRPH